MFRHASGRRTGHFLLCLLLVLVVTACGGSGAEPVVAPTAAPASTATVSRLATVIALETVAPTATAVSTATAASTATPRPSPPVTDTPAPTATAGGLQMRVVTPGSDGGARYSVVGFSANGHAIEAFEVGDGPEEIIIVGGIHGGYEWNSILLAYQLVDYFSGTPDAIPSSVTITVIPAANPDGQMATTGVRGRFSPADVAADTASGRFNGNGVDLNRNWDCAWTATGWWGTRPVSGGSAPFSESETRALRDLILERSPRLVIFLHSAAPGVFLGNCTGQILADTATWGAAYADAAGYPISETFEAYVINGDASNYLTLMGIPSFAVELTTHDGTDLDRNIGGVQAVLSYFP